MKRPAACLALALVALLFPAVPLPAAKPPKDAVGADDPFSQSKILRLQIDLPAAAIEALKKDPKTYVKATVREGSQAFNDVAVRLKGNGSFQGLEKKPSLALKFNEFAQGQKFHGHTKLLLNNSHQDPSYLCETLGGQIFRDAGVPAARTTWARLELNGRDAGLYVVTEAINKDFLSRHFKKSKGNLYEGSNNDVTDKLDKDSGDDSTDPTDLKDLVQAAQEPDAALRWQKLSKHLDLDRFVTFAAVEVLAWHHDGYSMDRNNYRIYHDPAADRMVFLPHGLDLLFGKAEGPLWPEWKGLVARAVLETPAGKQRYIESIAKLLGTVAPAATLQSRVRELAEKIRPSLTGQDEQKTFDKAVARLAEHIGQRAAFLEAELKRPQQAAKR